MNADHILKVLNDHRVDYLLIGGVNFLLRHSPVLTYDVDVWIEDCDENRRRCERSLTALDAEWGADDDDWEPVAKKPSGWLDRQGIFCLNTPHGAVDIFRSVMGLDDWSVAKDRSVEGCTRSGVPYSGLSDQDMLTCQLVLDQSQQNEVRIKALRRALGRKDDHDR
jgi:hypothetical protein